MIFIHLGIDGFKNRLQPYVSGATAVLLLHVLKHSCFIVPLVVFMTLMVVVVEEEHAAILHNEHEVHERRMPRFTQLYIRLAATVCRFDLDGNPARCRCKLP
jgi:hypothetical protein